MWPDRKDARPIAAVFALALATPMVTAWLAAREVGLPLSVLAVYFDGNLYLEIAKSFPLPYAPEGRDYISHAPGYPALVHLVRVATGGVLDWGLLALLASWLPAALGAVACYLLCREVGAPPFWASVLFAVGNPRWWSIAATAHAESLAVLFVLLTFLAHLRGRLGWSMLWLTLAGVTRFPALLVGLPLAWDLLVSRRQRSLRTWAWLGAPVAAFGLLNLYLAWRIPGFGGLWQAHGDLWQTGLTWPFAELVRNAGRWSQGNRLYFEITYATLVVHVVAVAVGWRSPQRGVRLLAQAVAAIVLFHASLAGSPAAWDFTRLAVLAWPLGLVVLWQRFGARLPNAAAATLCVVLAVVGMRTGLRAIGDAVAWQNQILPYLQGSIRRLDSDEPRWIDFGVRP